MPEWVVVENTPGYLPDSDEPAVFDDLGTATEYAETLADELADDGYNLTENDDKTFFYAERDADDLGRVIEVMEIPEGAADYL